jgi:uncharacterized protein YbjT (DUF2867 family)
MKIVVNTPSGNIGRAVVAALLDAKHDVVLISRHPAKVTEAVLRGAKLVEGSVDNPEVLDRSLNGAEALFWLTPIAFDPSDYMAWARQIGRTAASLAQRHGVSRAVVISSIGAQHDTGVGPVGCQPAVEAAFAKAVPNLTVLRPGSFMENLLMHAASIAQTGTMFGRYPTSKRIPWIATRDIAATAVQALTDRTPTGRRILELQGPEDLDQLQVASIVSEGIGRPVRYVEVSEEQARQGMLATGMPGPFADLLLEMYAALNVGRMQREQPRTPATTTPTTLLEFAREVLKPAVDVQPIPASSRQAPRD